MECFIARTDDIHPSENMILLRDNEAKHLAKSLRMREGDECLITDLQGCCYLCVIKRIAHSRSEVVVECNILRALPEHNEPDHKAALAFGLLQKHSDIELILEKCTELGITEFYPFTSHRTERETLNWDRCDRIIETAVKQTSRARKPVVHPVRSFEQLLNTNINEYQSRFIFHEAVTVSKKISDIRNIDSVLLLIGPEGGFTEDEVETASSGYGLLTLSLGTRRLRAETAAIAAVSNVLC